MRINQYITPAFFSKCLKSLQSKTRAQSTHEDTLRYRRLIDHNIEEFCVVYRFHLVRVEGNQSNWEAYVARQMFTPMQKCILVDIYDQLSILYLTSNNYGR